MPTVDSAQLRAAIGPNADYYLRRFEAIDDGRRAGWNWPAFFLSTAWFGYRGMTGLAVLNFFAPWIAWILTVTVGILSSFLILPMVLGYLVLAYVVVPMHANAWYYRRLQRDITRAAAPEQMPSPPGGVRKSVAAIAGAIMILVPTGIAVVARSAYHDFGARAQVSEAISLLSGAKMPVAEYRAEMRKWPDNLNQVVENTSGKYTERIEITSGAGAASVPLTITATMKSRNVNSSIAGRTIELSSADGSNWTCRGGAVNGVDNRYLPAACRH